MRKYFKGTALEKYASIQPEEKKVYYPLSPAQRRMYILQRMEPGNISCNMPQFIPFDEAVDMQRLEAAFRKLITRHESLRTSFHMVNEEPVQRIHNQVEFKIERLPGLDEASPVTAAREPAPAACHRQLVTSFIKAFDLSQAPLMRLGTVPLQVNRYLLIVDIHHIVSDGVSREILVREFQSLYNGEKLPASRLQYKDYARWQNSKEQQEAVRLQEKYWLEKFSGEIPVLNLPGDYPRPVSQSFEGKTIAFWLTAAETRGLNELASQEEATLYMVLVSILNVLLAKLSGQEDIVVGMAAPGRRHANLRCIIGMFVNTLALRNYPSGHLPFVEFLKEVKKHTLETFENQDYPFENLVEKVQVVKDTSRSPLFDVMFILRNPVNPGGEPRDGNGPPADKQECSVYEHRVSKFDLSIVGLEIGGHLRFDFQYCTRLFKKETSERFIAYFKKTVTSVLESPAKKISDMEIIPEAEKQRIIEQFNDTASDYPWDKTMHELVEEQAARIPDRISVIEIGHRDEVHRKLFKKKDRKGVGMSPGIRFPIPQQQISYKELNQRANQLAHLLRLKSVKPDTIVGIMVEPSIEMIFAFLGILKAGGAYLPIDPDYPEERINYMLKDSKVRVLVTTPKLQVKVKAEVKKNFRQPLQLLLDFVNIETGPASAFDSSPSTLTSTLTCQVSPANLAYIIYTSGTTGKPKGVLIQHRSLVRLMVNDNFPFDFHEDDIWTLFHSTCFDFSVWEMFGALLYGGRLVIVPKMVARDTEGFLQLLKEKQVTILNQIPSAFYNLANLELNNPGKELSIRYIIFGGETLAPTRLKEWKQKYAGTKLINMYGITETTVHVTFKEITRSEIENNTSNIGKPIPTLSVYLTDKYLKPVPIGVAGEIVVGGAGVGRGYLNRPELTSERFCLHPTSLKSLNTLNTLKVPGQKNQKNHKSYRSYMSYILYKSGDLARWLPNGEMEYLGRIDQQVKIRGYRIETGEIEAVLNRHPGISESVVAARENIPGSKRLVAYVAAWNPGEPPPAEVELRHFLQAKLPDYMIPAQFVHLDAFPLFANGKIDRRNLPSPGLAVVKAGKPAVSPRTPVEKKLTSIIADVLNLDRVSILDNFFQLGGDSLLSFRVVLLAKQVGIEITISDVFTHTTIEAMSAAARKEPAQQVEKNDSQDIYPLTPVQQQMFAYNLLTPDTVNTIQHLGWLMSGDLDIGAFKKAWQIVAQRHCILRTAFKRARLKEPAQQLYDSVTIPWQQMDCSHMTVEEQRQAVEDYISRDKKKRFKMSEQPLMRLFLFILDNHSYRFICSYSSLLLDNWSCHIIVKEIFHLYHSYINNRPPVLPERPRPFAGYVQWLLNHDLSEAQDFWKSELEGFDAPVDLGGQRINRDSPRSGFKLAQRQILLLPRESKALAKLAKKNRLTPGTILQGTWVMTLSYFSGQEDVLSGVLSYGRSGQFRGIESMAGLFINTVPVRTKVPADKDLITWLREFQDKQVSICQFDYVSNQDISNWSQAALHKIQTAIYERTFVLEKPPGEEFLSGLSPNNSIKISEFENSLVMNVPLRVYAELSAEIIIRLKYDRTCFLPDAVDDMARYWEILLRHLLDTPGVLLGYLKNKTQIYPRRKS